MWGSVRSPVSVDEQVWIERSMRWFVGEFGAAPLNRAVALPAEEYFPGTLGDTEDDVRAVLDRVCGYMDVDRHRVELEFFTDSHEQLRRGSQFFGEGRHQGVAGHYRREHGQTIVSINGSQTGSPVSLVATIAHELCHERLIGEQRVSGDEPDHEQLTDLLTVYLGMGVFTANSAFTFTQNNAGWRTERLGYLDARMFGYGLAFYAWLRDESKPSWATHLSTNPRTYLKQGLRFKNRQRV